MKSFTTKNPARWLGGRIPSIRGYLVSGRRIGDLARYTVAFALGWFLPVFSRECVVPSMLKGVSQTWIAIGRLPELLVVQIGSCWTQTETQAQSPKPPIQATNRNHSSKPLIQTTFGRDMNVFFGKPTKAQASAFC